MVRRTIGKVQAGILFAALGLMSCAVTAIPESNAVDVHPELSEQEQLIACADCHSEATPDLQKEWYDSVHGIAMIKCYMCHGTFGESFVVSPSKDNCATCHADQLDKEPSKPCFECHVPHSFKAKE